MKEKWGLSLLRSKADIKHPQLHKIKRDVKTLHKIDHNLVPQFLDDLKDKLGVKGKDMTKDDELLKYM